MNGFFGMPIGPSRAVAFQSDQRALVAGGAVTLNAGRGIPAVGAVVRTVVRVEVDLAPLVAGAFTPTLPELIAWAGNLLQVPNWGVRGGGGAAIIGGPADATGLLRSQVMHRRRAIGAASPNMIGGEVVPWTGGSHRAFLEIEIQASDLPGRRETDLAFDVGEISNTVVQFQTPAFLGQAIGAFTFNVTNITFTLLHYVVANQRPTSPDRLVYLEFQGNDPTDVLPAHQYYSLHAAGTGGLTAVAAADASTAAAAQVAIRLGGEPFLGMPETSPQALWLYYLQQCQAKGVPEYPAPGQIALIPATPILSPGYVAGPMGRPEITQAQVLTPGAPRVYEAWVVAGTGKGAC